MSTWNATPPVDLMPGEVWRPVPGNERLFSVSNRGRVWNWYRNRLVHSWLNGKRGLEVKLKGKSHRIAHLVLEAFGHPQPAGTYAAHVNGDRADCFLGNLFWRPVKDLQRETYRPRTKCNQGHKLSEVNGKRRCLTCKPLKEVVEPESKRPAIAGGMTRS